MRVSFRSYSAETIAPVLVNRKCFADSEHMDLVLLVCTDVMLQYRNGHFSKIAGIRAALTHYKNVAWVGMEGLTPFSARDESRTVSHCTHNLALS